MRASALIIAPAQVKILEHFKERGALALGIILQQCNLFVLVLPLA